MRASKENAKKAAKVFRRVVEASYSDESAFTRDCKFIDDFLAAAEKKLPSDAAFERDRSRRANAKGGAA